MMAPDVQPTPMHLVPPRPPIITPPPDDYVSLPPRYRELVAALKAIEAKAEPLMVEAREKQRVYDQAMDLATSVGGALPSPSNRSDFVSELVCEGDLDVAVYACIRAFLDSLGWKR